MYSVKLFGPDTKENVEYAANYFLQNAGNLKLLDTKTRIDTDGTCVMTLVLATPRPFDARHLAIVDSFGGSSNIQRSIDQFKEDTTNLRKIEDVVIVPANADHSKVYLKITYTLEKGSNSFHRNR